MPRPVLALCIFAYLHDKQADNCKTTRPGLDYFLLFIPL